MNALTQVPVKHGAAATARPAFSNVFGSLQREIDRLFEDFTPAFLGNRALSGCACRLNLAETRDALELTLELPGLDENDVQVSVSDGVLTVSGEKKIEAEEMDKAWRFFERSYGAFSRSIELPKGVDADRIRASLEKGVLKVTIPTPAKPEARKIEVKTAA
jgi:HSP20 family protein